MTAAAFTSRQSIVRPANTTAYAANDVVGAAAAVIEFTGMGPPGGVIVIRAADLMYEAAAVPTGMASMRLQLYTATPPSALADNAAFDLPAGDRSIYRGYVDLGSLADFGSTLFAQADGIEKEIRLASGSTSLFGYLVTNGAYTPGSADAFTISLRGLVL